MDEDTVLIDSSDCPLSSDGKHHMLRRMVENVLESEVCIFCDRGRYFPIGKVKYADPLTLDLADLREQLRRQPASSATQLEEIEKELQMRGYNEK